MHCVDVLCVDVHCVDVHCVDVHCVDVCCVDVRCVDVHCVDVHCVDVYYVVCAAGGTVPTVVLLQAVGSQSAPVRSSLPLLGQGILFRYSDIYYAEVYVDVDDCNIRNAYPHDAQMEAHRIRTQS